MSDDNHTGVSKMRNRNVRSASPKILKGHDQRGKSFWKSLLPSVLVGLMSLPALAAQQQYSFTVTGNNGETGSGTFIWDDAVIPDGGTLDILAGDFLSFSVTINGGNATGGSTTFDLAGCTSLAASFTPTFSIQFRANCFNGTDDISQTITEFEWELFNAAGDFSTITVAPGTTMPVPPSPSTPAQPVPVASIWMLIAASLGLGFLARRRLRSGYRRAPGSRSG